MVYTDDRLHALTARILDHLREAGPTARMDFPHVFPELTDYALQRCLRPLIRAGTVRATTERRRHKIRTAGGGFTFMTTTATFYRLTLVPIPPKGGRSKK
jgi:hypothetical protein